MIKHLILDIINAFSWSYKPKSTQDVLSIIFWRIVIITLISFMIVLCRL